MGSSYLLKPTLILRHQPRPHHVVQPVPYSAQDQEALLGGYSSEEELLAQARARCARDAPKGKDKEQVNPQALMANAKQVIMVRCSNAECASTLKAQVALSSGSVSLRCPSCSTVTPYPATSTAGGLCVD